MYPRRDPTEASKVKAVRLTTGEIETIGALAKAQGVSWSDALRGLIDKERKRQARQARAARKARES